MVRSGKERIPVQTDLKWRIVFVLEPVTTRLLTYVVTRKRPPIDMPTESRFLRDTGRCLA